MTNANTSLDALRREIDAIDDQLHDLIMFRTEVVKRVRNVKRADKIKIRPAREAEIVYRLIERHRGPFPKRELVRMWRELIVATLAFEGPFSVAVFMPQRSSGYWDLARDQYGSFTPMKSHVSALRVIDAVRKREVTLGVLPLPTPDDENPWWRHLIADGDDVPRIIARLPFAGAGNARNASAEALVICPVAQEPTGRDRSHFAIETEDEIALDRLNAALDKAKLPASAVFHWLDADESGTWAYLIEVDDFVPAGDARTARFVDALKRRVLRTVPVGGYAVPLGPKDLATEDEVP